MKNSFNIFFCLVAICIGSSCSRTTPKIDEQGYDWSGKDVELKAQELVYDTIPMRSLEFLVLEDHLVFCEQIPTGKQVLIYEMAGIDSLRLKGRVLHRGNGPYELRMPAIRYLPDSKTLQMIGFRNGENKMYSVVLDSMGFLFDMKQWKEVLLKGCGGGASEVVPCDDTTLMIIPSMPEDNMLSLVRQGDSSATSLGMAYPDDGVGASVQVKSLLYSGDICKHPSRPKFVYASRNGKYVFLFEVEGSAVQNQRVLYDRYPKYEEGANFSYAFSPDSPLWMKPVVTDKYVYLLNCHGTMKEYAEDQLSEEGYPLHFGNEVFVFDWDGNPVRRYSLDRPVSNIQVGIGEKYLYGITQVLQSGEEAMVRFIL